MNDNNQWWDDPDQTRQIGQNGGQPNPQGGQLNPPQGGQPNTYGGQPNPPQGGQPNTYGGQPYQQGGQQNPYGYNPGGGRPGPPPGPLPGPMPGPMPGPFPPYNPPAIGPQPGFIESIKLFFTQFATFTGRSRRSEFWYVYLFQFLLSLVFSLVGATQLYYLVSIVLIVPTFALQCRRLHDIGKSGQLIWLQVLSTVFFYVCLFYLIVYMIYNVPEVLTVYREQGIDVSVFQSFYPILNIPGSVILIFFLVAVAIWIMFLVFNCTDSNKGTNKYGPSQKYPDLNQSPYHP
jgi:uncharacterized membrane protein YhaH (DUF805 family)